jgi:transposase-like protein
MALGRSRDDSKEQQWRRWIAQWRTSGLSVAAFCARHGLAAPSFYAWRRTLQRRDSSPAAFVPVQLVADEVPDSGRLLEVVLPDGRLVRVPAGFDAATLRQLLAVLREEPSC